MEPEPDAWGLHSSEPDHASDVELGWTAAEDGDWGPAQIYVAAPVTRALFAWHFATFGYGLLRWAVCKAGVHRRRH